MPLPQTSIFSYRVPSPQSAIPSEQDEYRQAFALFDKRGQGRIPREVLGELLRSLGQNPTEREVGELGARVGATCESSEEHRAKREGTAGKRCPSEARIIERSERASQARIPERSENFSAAGKEPRGRGRTAEH